MLNTGSNDTYSTAFLSWTRELVAKDLLTHLADDQTVRLGLEFALHVRLFTLESQNRITYPAAKGLMAFTLTLKLISSRSEYGTLKCDELPYILSHLPASLRLQVVVSIRYVSQNLIRLSLPG